MLLKGLNCLEDKMLKSPDLAANLQVKIKDFVMKGYVGKLHDDEIRQPKKVILANVRNNERVGSTVLVPKYIVQIMREFSCYCWLAICIAKMF